MVTEKDLVLRSQMVEGGVEIQELERLARTLGLTAVAREATAHEIRDLLRGGSDVIAYINRSVFHLTTLTDLTPALRPGGFMPSSRSTSQRGRSLFMTRSRLPSSPRPSDASRRRSGICG